MTEASHKPKIVEYVVVVFDMCSSSNMMEDLTLTGNIKRLRDLMISLKKWLNEKSKEYDFEVYKFTGDGWILLFSPDVAGSNGFCAHVLHPPREAATSMFWSQFE